MTDQTMTDQTMTDQTVQLVLDGIQYTWNGEVWYETKTFMIPPTKIIGRLDIELGKQLGLKKAA